MRYLWQGNGDNEQIDSPQANPHQSGRRPTSLHPLREEVSTQKLFEYSHVVARSGQEGEIFVLQAQAEEEGGWRGQEGCGWGEDWETEKDGGGKGDRSS